MKLEIEDQNKVMEFVEKYRIMGKKINEMEFIIEKLIQERDSLVNELEYTRQEEISFVDKLSLKYGDKEVMEEFKNLILC